MFHFSLYIRSVPLRIHGAGQFPAASRPLYISPPCASAHGGRGSRLFVAEWGRALPDASDGSIFCRFSWWGIPRVFGTSVLVVCGHGIPQIFIESSVDVAFRLHSSSCFSGIDIPGGRSREAGARNPQSPTARDCSKSRSGEFC